MCDDHSRRQQRADESKAEIVVELSKVYELLTVANRCKVE